MHRYLAATAYDAVATPETAAADQTPSTTPAAQPHDEQGSESHPTTGNLVVVGLDGSGCAQHAADWAAAEAAHRHADLTLVFAYHLPPAGTTGYNPYPPHLLADLREDGAAVLSETAAVLQRHHSDVKISTTLSYGDPATVLRHASGTAKLTVVGTHGGNRMRVALGSVAASVAATSPSPVAVIHPGSANRNGPVVAGVDGSANSRAALTYAFQAAADRNATLIAVHCWTDPSIDGPVPAYSAGIVDPDAIRLQEQHRLDAELADLIGKYPSVHVKQAVIHDRPASGLLRFSGTAQLIVAGSHGHHGVTGLLLGSTTQALIAHSTSPVVIARPAVES